MNAAQVLRAARAAGIRIDIDGDELVLSARETPPSTILDLLSRHKAGIVPLLRTTTDGRSVEDWQALFHEAVARASTRGFRSTEALSLAFASCVAEWLNRNPVQSLAGRCVFCGRTNSPGAVVLPFGTAMRGHAWLHAECWPAWYRARQLKAMAVLRALGLKPTAESESPSNADSHQSLAKVEP